jgi:hypothetical protein
LLRILREEDWQNTYRSTDDWTIAPEVREEEELRIINVEENLEDWLIRIEADARWNLSAYLHRGP